MRFTHQDTAILLFSRSAAEDALKKPLTTFKCGENQGIAQLLIHHARQVAKHSGLPVFVISENEQHGFSFGERFADAFSQLFARGFDRVISIGNDCPSLNSADLQTAAQKLETNQAVFGPTSDGGAYLIGLHRTIFNPTTFAALEWQTEKTLADLKVYAAAAYYCLSQKSDLDTPADFQKELHSPLFPKILKTKLLNLLKPTFSGRAPAIVFIPLSNLLATTALRGPPVS